jgi:hypothetical protein
MFASSTTDWIGSVGSAFAAVGTVGAVIIALWQTRRRESYDVRVTCTSIAGADKNVGTVIGLHAVNAGERMVRLTMAYLMTDANKRVVAKFWGHDDSLSWAANVAQTFSKPLGAGEDLTVYWQLTTLESLKAQSSLTSYVRVYFTDVLGNEYSAPYPGVLLKRSGLLRRKSRYIESSQAP